MFDGEEKSVLGARPLRLDGHDRFGLVLYVVDITVLKRNRDFSETTRLSSGESAARRVHRQDSTSSQFWVMSYQDNIQVENFL